LPYIKDSKYDKSIPFLHKNKHFSTIYAAKVKRFSSPNYQREKLELHDGDFLNIDYKMQSKSKAVILCHGLEGNSQRTYINSCSNYFLKQDFSVFAWNNRSCGGEMNRLPQLYHHASIEDLDAVVQFVLSKEIQEIYLIGFSMGGAQVLNYLGRIPDLSAKVKAGVAVSVPIEIKASADSLKKGFNQVYMKNFVLDLTKKLKIKAQQFPDLMEWENIKKVKNFDYLDDNFTAPMHGFIDKYDYYFKVSPARSNDKIDKPVLIINAFDDPFLGEGCFPTEIATKNSYIHLETPKYGGHCAYPMKNSVYSYAEIRAFEFFNSI
jgi:uncharacterized protein